MKRAITICGAAALLTIATGSAWAQQDSPPAFEPIEIYGCSFRGDSDMADLDRVIADWNDWMDDHSANDYFALTMRPFYFSGEITADVLWLGAWPDGASMGDGQGLWAAEGGDLEGDFEEILDCPGHSGYASLTIKPPAENAGLGPTGPIEFTDCTVHEGRTTGEALGAIREWVQFNSDNGADTAHWVLFPGPGQASDADYNFKWVKGHPSHASYGRAFDQLTTGRGFMTYGDLFSRLLTCDSPRVYLGNIVRTPAADAD